MCLTNLQINLINFNIYGFFCNLQYAHTYLMNIDQLDEKLVHEPLSKNQRIALINAFLNRIYLQGIDKGTLLEQSRLIRIAALKKKMFDKKYELFLDKVEDLINIHEKRVYREKYKGRYNYYVPKKPAKSKKTVTIYKQQHLW